MNEITQKNLQYLFSLHSSTCFPSKFAHDHSLNHIGVELCMDSIRKCKFVCDVSEYARFYKHRHCQTIDGHVSIPMIRELLKSQRFVYIDNLQVSYFIEMKLRVVGDDADLQFENISLFNHDLVGGNQESISFETLLESNSPLYGNDVELRPLKVFWQQCTGEGSLITFYWDTDIEIENSRQPFGLLTPWILTQIQQFRDFIIRARLGVSDLNAVGVDLPGVSDELEHPDPDGFKLNLRPYQSKTLSWMLRREQSDSETEFENDFLILGESNQVLDLRASSYYNCSAKVPLNSFRGGILADNTGIGKTVTVLSLIKENPYTQPFSENEGILKATLVLCPSNLCRQWQEEYEKCIETTLENFNGVLIITTMAEMRSFTPEDFTDAHLIIISHSFLANKNFQSRFSSLKVKLFRYFYHRIVIDEVHELVDYLYGISGRPRDAGMFSMFSKLRAANWWGLTGTPNFHLHQRIVKTANLFGVDFPQLPGFCASFLQIFVRRSIIQLEELPAIHYQQININLTPEERAIYQSLSNDTQSALRLCSHFNLQDYANIRLEPNEDKNVPDDNRLVSVTDVAAVIQGQRVNEMTTISKELEMIAKEQEELEKQNPVSDKVKSQLAKLRSKTSSLISRYQLVEGEHKFFQNVIDTLNNRQEQECNICFSPFDPNDSVALTRCGHIFCQDCIERCARINQSCPICRRFFDLSSIYIVKPPEIAKEESEQSDDEPAFEAGPEVLDQQFYGSKVSALAAYITQLLSDNNGDNNNRIILFIQFSELAKLVSKALNSLGILNSFVYGNVLIRTKAIHRFKCKEIKVILLSAESSVSGLQLTEATHVLLMHPFFYGDDQVDKAVASEKQGVARAYRLGLKHELYVVRFIVKDSIEETLMMNRPRLPI